SCVSFDHGLFSGFQAWSHWRKQLLLVQRERWKVVSAVKHHQHWQKWRSLKIWCEYLQVRRVKRQQNAMAERFHRVTVLQTYFCDWQWAWEQRKSMYTHRARVEGLARRMVLRRAFTHWKHYMLLRAEEAAQWRAAEEHWSRTLLHFGIRALKDNVTHARLQRVRRNLARQQHGIMLLHRFWNIWQSRIEQREEQKQLPLLRAASDHYRITVLRKFVRLWSQYTQRRREKQLLQARADSHFQQGALPAAFQAWKRLWWWHKQGSALDARAARFHREMLEKQVFAIWWQKMFQHQEDRLAERMAVLHAERQLLRRAWFTWHQQAVACCRARRWQVAACAHHCLGQLRKAFCIWRESARGLRAERMGRELAAEFHSTRLLHQAWNRWRETYQSQVLSILQEVAARESRHKRQLLRAVFHLWRENTRARVDEAKKTCQAGAHYRRTLLSKVLVQWQEMVSVQIYYRQQEDCAIREAQEVLGRGCLRAWFQHWRVCGQRATLETVQLERAAQHYHQQLLLQVLTGWKAHHLGCVRKRLRDTRSHLDTPACCRRPLASSGPPAVLGGDSSLGPTTPHGCPHVVWAWGPGCIQPTAPVHTLSPQLLQRQGAQLLAQTLGRSCFRQWRQQLVTRRQEQQATVRALWFWSFSLQAKVWAAWLGFVLERKRKKARLERAVQAYRQQLLQEGVPRLLRFTADMKAFRRELHAQQQVQAVHSLHHAVHRCAMLWKQKVLGPGREPQPRAYAMPGKRVTFEGPLPDCVAAGAGGATLETKRPRAPWGPQGAPGSLAVAARDPQLLELNVARLARKQPRRPDFLLEPMWSQRPKGCGTLRGQGSEVPWEHSLGMAQPAGPSLTRPVLAKAWTALVPGSRRPPPEAQPGPPGLKLPPRVHPGPELLPPSSFMPCRVEAPARLSTWLTTPGLRSQAPLPPASVPEPRLLLPWDFTGTRPEPSSGSAAAGASLRPVGMAGTWDPPIQPGPCREGGPQQAPSVALGHTDLEAELEGIRQQLQDHQTTKQNLRSCQRQARSLRRWLELSQEEPRPEDQEAAQRVQEELQEVELQIQQLAAKLQAQCQPISACIARIQALRQALC
ncbi:hypothetical protein MC885_016457, partial [Smutsia gigantea]